MSSAGITFSGLGSGIDSQAIIAQLVQLERIPIGQIELKITEQKNKLSKIGQLKTILQKLGDKAKTLGDEDSFFTFSTSIANASLATVSASGNAVAGSHTLEVTQVAATDRWAFDGVADPDADLAGAIGETLTFTANGTDYTVTIDNQASSSLYQIASKINSAASADVQASVVNAGTDASPSYQLVLTAKTSGEDGAITNLTTDIAGLNAVATNITVGENAIAIIDGLTIQRTDNDFSDVIAGVSVDLLSAEPGVETYFTIDPDKESIKGRIRDFIAAYNEVVTFVNTQNTYDEEDGAKGELFGDGLLRTVRSTITNALNDIDPTVVAADTEGYSTLSLVGIKQESDGKLTIVNNTLDEKVTENLSAFADLFIDYDGFDNGGALPNTSDFFEDTTADSGLMATLERQLNRLLKSQDGEINPATGSRDVIRSTFDLKKATINTQVARLEDQIEARERRISSYRETLVRQFANLESVMAELQSQGNFLSSAGF